MKPLKPGYKPEAVQAQLIREICLFFGRIYDDFEEERHLALRGRRAKDPKRIELIGDNPTINETASFFSISPAKIRKILITGGYYDTENYRKIQESIAKGLNIAEIADLLGMKQITVRSYLPYERVIYNLDERSVNAERLVRFKERWGGYRKTDI